MHTQTPSVSSLKIQVGQYVAASEECGCPARSTLLFRKFQRFSVIFFLPFKKQQQRFAGYAELLTNMTVDPAGCSGRRKSPQIILFF